MAALFERAALVHMAVPHDLVDIAHPVPAECGAVLAIANASILPIAPVHAATSEVRLLVRELRGVGLDISYETVRRWMLKFGPTIARRLRQRRPAIAGIWTRWWCASRAESLLAALFELLVEDLAACSEFVALKGGRQSRAQLLDQVFHCDRQSAASARRQLQAMGSLRVGEVVDVTPIRGRLFSLRLTEQQAFNRAMSTTAAGAERIHIIALAPHAYRELHGLDCSLLTDQPRRLLEFGAHSEWQLGRIAPTVQQRRRKRLANGEGRTGRVFSSRNINFPQFRHLRRATPVPICTPITREATEAGSQAAHCWRKADSNSRSHVLVLSSARSCRFRRGRFAAVGFAV